MSHSVVVFLIGVACTLLEKVLLAGSTCLLACLCHLPGPCRHHVGLWQLMLHSFFVIMSVVVCTLLKNVQLAVVTCLLACLRQVKLLACSCRCTGCKLTSFHMVNMDSICISFK
jgi:hypothetical protein